MQHYFGLEKKNNQILLDKEDYHHIKNVMRYNEDAKIIVNVENKSYLCSLNRDLKSVTIIKEVDSISNLSIRLFVPILSDNKMSFIIEKVTELGVNEIVLIPLSKCKFTIPREKLNKKIDRYKKIVKAASMQCGRINIPDISYVSKIEDIKKEKYNIICSLDSNNVNKIEEVLKKCKACDIIQVVFGPEGGFSSLEEEMFETIGFKKVSLGSRVLRTETAPIVVLSIINYILEKE